MPYEWLPPEDDRRTLRLWPHRSLPRQGFVLFIGATAALVALPLISVLGTPVLWGILPFLVLAVAAIWWALMRSYKDAEILENLTLAPSSVELTRHGPRGRKQHWQANPYWVRVNLHRTGGPVPHYITLEGGPRVVEIGAFLSEEERVSLAKDLQINLQTLRG